eukprot:Gregarina_sp_Poly_1__2963@NODE_182_length_11803_cov_169_166752_g162_i0_p12_GENE_NODE_182_length_11803_cov_169_166752_g162_i0NODE_182_length_11803_cov_169_166752_g162_i0_p12_ORF_typecomplete_len100_score0_75_NODE_182_length_11803_cov_169_166752_g162_i017182017
MAVLSINGCHSVFHCRNFCIEARGFAVEYHHFSVLHYSIVLYEYFWIFQFTLWLPWNLGSLPGTTAPLQLYLGIHKTHRASVFILYDNWELTTRSVHIL